MTLPTLLPALVLLGGDAAPTPNVPSPGIAAAETRESLPRFDELTGPRPGDHLTPADLVGRVTVINIWYEW